MTNAPSDPLFERDFAASFNTLLTWVMPIVVVTALVYGVALLLTQQWVLGVLGVLTFLTAPIAWYTRRLLKQGRIWTSLTLFIIAMLLILSSALLLVRGLDTAILAGFSIPILATALLRNVRVSIGIAVLTAVFYACSTLLAGFLPWQQTVLPPDVGQLLTLAILIAVFGILGVLSWQIVRMLQRALALAHEHIQALSQATLEQQRIHATLEGEYQEQRRLLTIIADLETPIIPLRRDVLLVPLMGSFDSRRAEAAQTRILNATVELRARLVIVDITGVALIDNAVAQQLLRTAQGVRLLGAEALFTGIKSNVAQALVHVGIDLRQFRSIATLEAGIDAVISVDSSAN